MESVSTILPQPSGAPDAAPPVTGSASPSMRKCLVTGEERPKTELIRFVVGPDSVLVPDLAQNLPGRGLWVTASREAITQAAKKNLFAKAAHASVQVAPDLADQVERLLRKRCLEFMGLTKGAGAAVLGQTQVEAAARAGKLTVLLYASDATDQMHTENVYISRVFARDDLGKAFGYEQIVYAGFTAHGMAARLKQELMRLENITTSHHIS